MAARSEAVGTGEKGVANEPASDKTSCCDRTRNVCTSSVFAVTAPLSWSVNLLPCEVQGTRPVAVILWNTRSFFADGTLVLRSHFDCTERDRFNRAITSQSSKIRVYGGSMTMSSTRDELAITSAYSVCCRPFKYFAASTDASLCGALATVLAVSCTGEGATPTDEPDDVDMDAAANVFAAFEDDDDATGAEIDTIAGPGAAADVAFNIPDSPSTLPTPNAHNARGDSWMACSEFLVSGVRVG